MTGRWGAARPVTLTDMSDHPTACAILSPTTLFSWGLLFKPHGWLKLTLLAICIDIATL
jgi:hypothetical protein